MLEAGFVVFRVPPWLRNVRKRLVKAPKLHFVDSGLACHLLGIRDPAQLRVHPLRGALFESWCASEILKARVHRGELAGLFHLREARGTELDLVVEAAGHVAGVEVKSGATLAPAFFRSLAGFSDRARQASPHLKPVARLIYGGDGPRHERQGVDVVPWSAVQDAEWA